MGISYQGGDPMCKYAVMAERLMETEFLASLNAEDRKDAMDAANAFRIVDDYLENNVQVDIGLDVLIKAEETYDRLIKAH
jgi:hypothetical protein